MFDGGLCLSSAHPFFYYHLLSYHSIISTTKLFASILLRLFGSAIYSSLNGQVWLLVLLLRHWQAPVSHLFSLGRPWLICFSWAPLVLFLTLHSHGLLLSFLGFLGPITLSIILGAYGFAINPLLSLLLLLWFCRDPLSLFHIIYYPWFAFFSLFPSSFKPICLLKAHLFISKALIHYSCRLDLMSFLSIYQLFSVRVVRLLLSTWTSKMAINTDFKNQCNCSILCNLIVLEISIL